MNETCGTYLHFTSLLLAFPHRRLGCCSRLLKQRCQPFCLKRTDFDFRAQVYHAPVAVGSQGMQLGAARIQLAFRLLRALRCRHDLRQAGT